ncbi:MAG: hypothetical protein H0X50_06800 [Nitrosopumilus sp.]|nr:hypothetical protein [Nitrosopumilus sp.]
MIPLIQTANAQSILDQIGGAFNNLTSPGGQSQYSITGQDAFSPNVNTTPSGQTPNTTSGTTAGQAGQSPSGTTAGQAGQSPSGTNTPAGAGASDGRQDLASPAGEKAFEEGMSTADQAGQAPLIARQTSNNTGGQFESTLEKPAGMAGVIQDTPNYDKVVPNAGETTSNAVIQANQSENNVQTSTAKYPSNGSRPSVSGLTDVRPSEYMNYTSELNKANIGGNDTPKLATTIGDAFKDTSKTIGDAVGNIIPK